MIKTKRRNQEVKRKMYCSNCQKDIDEELVSHIVVNHPGVILYKLFQSLPLNEQFSIIMDVFPDSRSLFNG